ncbi:MAG: hypothetical protein BMS9Abin23_0869 [Thermodesulfobacteriota bacterium]|nr:MAG: hypothetical protein BMS9Abin23_0869 [Thermodesulfobacteriota bacterium]
MENILEKEKILDVREMTPPERHPAIFKTFTDLGPGESFILVNDHDPKPLLYQFQNEHDGEFEWWPLEQGPEAWRISIVKRKTVETERTITDYMQEDHRRLDGIFNAFKEAFKEGRWDDAAAAFKEFNLGLRRHIAAEEEVLFPAFEEKTGMHESGPTFVMKMEHTEIKELMDRITAATDAKDLEKVSESTDALINFLVDHNMKEEHILYPESDSFLDDRERKDYIKKAQTL